MITKCLCLIVALSPLSSLIANEPKTEKDSDLIKAITTYLLAENTEAEQDALAKAVKSSNGSVLNVMAALNKVKLWKEPESREFNLHIPGTHHMLRVVLPTNYDHANRYPVIVTANKLALPDDAIVVRVPAVLFPQFHEPYDVRPSVWLRALRRTVHIDEDRVFLFGEGVNGDRALLTLVRGPEFFAGGAFWGSTLDVPYANVLGPMLLRHLKNTPVVLGWDRGALTDAAPADGRSLTVAVVNELLAARAAEIDVPVEPVLVDDRDAFWRSEAVSRLLDRRRGDVKRFEKWFRFGDGADVGGVRLTDVEDSRWQGDVIDISVADGMADEAGFVRGVLEEKLDRIRVTYSGQRISVEMSGGRGVEILVGCDCIDFNKPVTILLNRKRRFEGRLRASVRTVLEEAKRDWVFQRPVCARVRIRPRGDGRAF